MARVEVCRCLKTVKNQSAQVHRSTNLCQGALTYRSFVYWSEKPPLGQGCDSLLAQCLSSMPGVLAVTPSPADPGRGGTTGRWRQSQTFKTVFSYIASLRQAWTPWDSLKKKNTKLKVSKKMSKSDNLSLTPGTHCGIDSVVLLCTTAHVHTHTHAHTRIFF